MDSNFLYNKYINDLDLSALHNEDEGMLKNLIKEVGWNAERSIIIL